MQDTTEQTAAESFTTVVCRAELSTGEYCRGVLYRVYVDRIEGRFRLRNGNYAGFRAPLPAQSGFMVPCPNCGAEWWPLNATEPTRAPKGRSVLKAIA